MKKLSGWIYKTKIMIIDCPNCGSTYNQETVSRCPACRVVKHKRNKSRSFGDIGQFMRAEIRSKKAIVNSFRRAEVSKYEREKGKNVYQKF